MTSQRGGCNLQVAGCRLGLQVAGQNLEKQVKVLDDPPELLKQNTTMFW